MSIRLLNLDFLIGPADSMAENFELLCLELARVSLTDHECFQIKAPDGGIDIYARFRSDPSQSIALQCKAYRGFKAALVGDIAGSLGRAIASRSQYPWVRYIVNIPFVPTFEQRRRLDEVLWRCEIEFQLCHELQDANALETLLFAHREIARRFFPSIVIVTPPESAPFGMRSSERLTQVPFEVRIHAWNQTIPMAFDLDTSVGSVLAFIMGQLDLYTGGEIVIPDLNREHDFRLYWTLIVESEGDRRLDSTKTLREENLKPGSTLAMMYEIVLTGAGKGFFSRPSHTRPTELGAAVIRVRSPRGTYEALPMPPTFHDEVDVVKQAIALDLQSKKGSYRA